MPGKERELREWAPSRKLLDQLGSDARPRKRAAPVMQCAQGGSAVRVKKPTIKVPQEDTCTEAEFAALRIDSDELSRAAEPDNDNFFVDKILCVTVDLVGNQRSTSHRLT